MRDVKIEVTVNGRPRTDDVEPRLLLCDYLRDVCGLTGTHVGCDTGNCGACTVDLDGRSAKSCLFLAVQADARSVTTIEGVDHPLQGAFHRHHALQCGYCTPGMILSALQLLAANPSPTEREVRRAIAGNLCRCTGYQHIVEAVLDVR